MLWNPVVSCYYSYLEATDQLCYANYTPSVIRALTSCLGKLLLQPLSWYAICYRKIYSAQNSTGLLLGGNPSATSNYALIDGKNNGSDPETAYVLPGGKKKKEILFTFGVLSSGNDISYSWK